MKRDLTQLSDTTFDLLVIGGGVHGVWAAWDATLRGLSVALVDQGDWGGGTSANSLKIMHGGLRYLQQADIRRMRESIRERATLARVAPGLVRPMPFLVATQGHLQRSRRAMGTALRITDLIGLDRNRGLPPDLALPPGRTISADECLRLFPGFDGADVTGGAIWYDYQLHDSERLPLEIVRSAAEHGACIANYVRVRKLLVRDSAVFGARARDVMGGAEFDIRATTVLNAAGPWAGEITASALPGAGKPESRTAQLTALAINLVSRRPPLDLGVGVRAKTTAAEDPVCGGRRFLFFAPWRESTLIGTTYSVVHDGRETVPEVKRRQLQAFVNECNGACPQLELSLDDITFFHHGRLPLKGGRERGRPDALAGSPRIIDHQREHGVAGLVSVEGVKYTTARGVAERAVDLVFRVRQHTPPPCRTAAVPVCSEGPALPMSGPPAKGIPLPRNEVLHGIREEMALKMSDVIFRRSGLGSERRPPRSRLSAIADLCAEELGWSAARRQAEIDEVLDVYKPLLQS